MVGQSLPVRFCCDQRLLLCFLTMALAQGCVRVKAYQREIHAKPNMQDRQAVDEKLDEHVKEYREGSVGGAKSGGGGCGCN